MWPRSIVMCCKHLRIPVYPVHVTHGPAGVPRTCRDITYDKSVAEGILDKQDPQTGVLSVDNTPNALFVPCIGNTRRRCPSRIPCRPGSRPRAAVGSPRETRRPLPAIASRRQLCRPIAERQRSTPEWHTRTPEARAGRIPRTPRKHQTGKRRRGGPCRCRSPNTPASRLRTAACCEEGVEVQGERGGKLDDGGVSRP